MLTNNVCPDCKKTYSKPPERCICGWIRRESKEGVISDYTCRFVEYGKRCEETGTVAISTRSNEWYCGKHAPMARENSYKYK